MDEQILVVPRSDIPVEIPRKGFIACPGSIAQDLLKFRRFVERKKAETDPSLKQVIPYVVLQSDQSVFRYWRTKRAGESRLHHLYSVGVGGHINERDVSLFSSSEQEILLEATMRELREEVHLPPDIHPEFRGLLNDDTTDVGSVHLGAVFACKADRAQVEIRETGALGRGEWVENRLLQDGVTYESWSEILIDEWLKDM
ncbi:MAG: DNA mismatch repair protein MutT [bacterium]